MKSIYSLLIVSSQLAFGLTSNAAQKPYGPALDARFVVSGDEGYVECVITSPDKLMGDYSEGTEDIPIVGNMDIVLVKSCYDLNVKDVVVSEWKYITPNTKLSYTDKDIIIGEEWNYRAIAIVDNEESAAYYGTYSVYTGIRPMDVTDFSVRAEEGVAPVTLTFTVPNKMRDQEKYPNVAYTPERVYVTRQFREVGTYDNSAPEIIWEQTNPMTNRAITFQDDNDGKPMAEGIYYYNAVVAWKWGESLPNTQHIGLYEAAPGTPRDIEVTSVDNGVAISWSVVTKPDNDGYIRPETVVYDVYRYFGYDSTELIAENIKETEYFDDLKGIEKQISLQYQIIAKNERGASSAFGGVSASIVVGPPCKLPFIETFGTNMNPDMLWTNVIYSGYVSWNSGMSAYFIASDGTINYIYPSDESNGLIFVPFASYAPIGDVAYLSGDIDFAGCTEGYLTLRFYQHPEGKVKLMVDLMNSDGSYDLTSSVPLDKVFVENIWSGSVNSKEEGWTEVFVPFECPSLKGNVKLRIRAVSDEMPENDLFIPAAIEYIKLESKGGDSVDLISPIDARVVTSQYFDLQGAQMKSPLKGQPIIKVCHMSDGRTLVIKEMWPEME